MPGEGEAVDQGVDRGGRLLAVQPGQERREHRQVALEGLALPVGSALLGLRQQLADLLLALRQGAIGASGVSRELLARFEQLMDRRSVVRQDLVGRLGEANLLRQGAFPLTGEGELALDLADPLAQSFRPVVDARGPPGDLAMAEPEIVIRQHENGIGRDRVIDIVVAAEADVVFG